MKKLNLLILVSLLCVGLAQAKQATTKYEKALLEAAKAGNASQVRGLLEAGTDPNVTDKDGNTPLALASYVGNLASVDMLLFAGASVNSTNKETMSPLIASILSNKTDNNDVISRILKAKPDMNAVYCQVDNNNQIYHCETALMLATQNNDIKTVEKLIAQGADVNKFTAPSGFALNKAITSYSTNSTKIVELLLKAGADPWRMDGYGKNPLALAKANGDKTKLELIKTAQVATKEQHKRDEKLCDEAYKCKAKKVKQLLDEGANPNASCALWSSTLYPVDYTNRDKNAFGRTPLMWAYGEQEIAQLLLNAGADINGVDGMGNTILHNIFVAKDGTGADVLTFLLNNGADINARNVFGYTPLYDNISHGMRFDKKTFLLLEAKGDPNIRNIYGVSPLMAAKRTHKDDLANALQKHGATFTKQDEADNELYFAQKAAEAANGSDANDLVNTFMQGLLNVGMATLQYGIDKGKL